MLPARGLHWISRLHLLTGIGSYITAPLWLLFILTGILIAVQARFVPPDYFPAGKSLFPQWPVIDPVRAMWMFVGTMALLLVPKLLGCIAIVLHGGERRGFGGALRLFASMLLETLIAGLIAPVVMLTQSIDVVAILLGRDSGLERAAARRRRRFPARDRRGCIGGTPCWACCSAAAAWLVSPSLALWMLPVVLGLALAIPLALLTGRRWSAVVCCAHRRNCRPRGCRRVRRRCSANGRIWACPTSRGCCAIRRCWQRTRRCCRHRGGRARIRSMRRALGRAKLEEAETLEEALAALSPEELAAVLGDPASLSRLSTLATVSVWRRLCSAVLDWLAYCAPALPQHGCSVYAAWLISAVSRMLNTNPMQSSIATMPSRSVSFVAFGHVGEPAWRLWFIDAAPAASHPRVERNRQSLFRQWRSNEAS